MANMRISCSKISVLLGLARVWLMAVAVGTEDQQLIGSREMPCIKPKQKCDHYTSPYRDKIIGGEVANIGSTPWLVSLQDMQYSQPIHFCGATLLNHLWILTSASCVSGYLLKYDQLQVVLGEYDMDQDDGWEMIRKVSVIITHPNFDSYTHQNDMALLKVNHMVFYNERVSPLSLPPLIHVDRSDDDDDGDNRNGNCWNFDVDDILDKHVMDNVIHVITGWGRTAEISEMSRVVMQAKVPLLPHSDCMAAYPDTFTQSMLCAGNFTYGGLDSCQGDWGGPLVSIDGYIRGVSSWAVGCGRPGFPSIYTDVTKYLLWICGIIIFST